MKNIVLIATFLSTIFMFQSCSLTSGVYGSKYDGCNVERSEDPFKGVTTLRTRTSTAKDGEGYSFLYSFFAENDKVGIIHHFRGRGQSSSPTGYLGDEAIVIFSDGEKFTLRCTKTLTIGTWLSPVYQMPTSLLKKFATVDVTAMRFSLKDTRGNRLEYSRRDYYSSESYQNIPSESQLDIKKNASCLNDEF